MAFCSNCWLLRDGSVRGLASDTARLNLHSRFIFTNNQKLFVKMPHHSTRTNPNQNHLTTCAKKKGRSKFDPMRDELPHSNSTDHIGGSRANIPGPELWPEGTMEQVRAAQAPPPKGVSDGSPSFGKSPGSRRSKKFSTNANGSESEDSEPVQTYEQSEITETELQPTQTTQETEFTELPLGTDSEGEDAESAKGEEQEEYVVYETEEENQSGWDLEKQLGNPHPFINPASPKIEGTVPNEDLWWNWRKEERWSRWQRPKRTVEAVFAKGMAQIGQIKLFGKEPTVAEVTITRARRHVFKEERLQVEKRRHKQIGPVAYYSEWVKAYKDIDVSREAVQKRYEETGMDENEQLKEMLSHQTLAEYRTMVGTDNRIRRDPLAMRMPEELIKEIWGGDPVYRTENYYRDEDEVIDYRGPEFHEHIPDVVTALLSTGQMAPADEYMAMLAKEEEGDEELSEIDQAMSSAVDIGENELLLEDNEGEKELKIDDGDAENWSLLKTSPHLQKPDEKPKKEGEMTLEEAIKDAVNLTDFIMDFEGGSDDD
ncbi:hypothetical protein LUZ60_001521 [Juncus effusus]|nr:hypothetical protein LUZ60_001521 [Juncus effusus]